MGCMIEWEWGWQWSWKKWTSPGWNRIASQCARKVVCTIPSSVDCKFSWGGGASWSALYSVETRKCSDRCDIPLIAAIFLWSLRHSSVARWTSARPGLHWIRSPPGQDYTGRRRMGRGVNIVEHKKGIGWMSSEKETRLSDKGITYVVALGASPPGRGQQPPLFKGGGWPSHRNSVVMRRLHHLLNMWVCAGTDQPFSFLTILENAVKWQYIWSPFVPKEVQVSWPADVIFHCYFFKRWPLETPCFCYRHL